MSKKDFQGIGKNIIENKSRATSLEELLIDNENFLNPEETKTQIDEKGELLKNEKTNKRKSDFRKMQGNIRYEARINEELDKRLRLYMFEQRVKTNPVLIAALDYFLTKHGY